MVSKNYRQNLYRQSVGTTGGSCINIGLSINLEYNKIKSYSIGTADFDFLQIDSAMVHDGLNKLLSKICT